MVSYHSETVSRYFYIYTINIVILMFRSTVAMKQMKNGWKNAIN